MLKGLETLGLRVEKMAQNAAAVADMLANHPKVERVYYAGHPSHAQYELAQRQMSGGSNMLAFDVKGQTGRRLYPGGQFGADQNLQQFGRCQKHHHPPGDNNPPTVGGRGSAELGISEKLLRLSVGLEAEEDLLSDLQFALDQI